jgi:hypothetical protein
MRGIVLPSQAETPSAPPPVKPAEPKTKTEHKEPPKEEEPQVKAKPKNTHKRANYSPKRSGKKR